MNAVRNAGALGLGTTLTAALVLVSSPAAFADDSAGCATGALPAAVVGDPGVQARQALGVYLWHGSHGYSLRVTHPGKDKLVVSGAITASRDITRLHRVTLEKNDRLALGAHRHTLDFRFANYGGIDGFDFTADCSKTVRVQLQIAGTPAAPAAVFLGKDRTSPTSVPFTIERAHDNASANVG